MRRSRRISCRGLAVPVLAAAVACVVAALPAFSAAAQLRPERLYYGLDRAMPMTVTRPDGAEGELSIRLLAPVTAAVEAKSPCGEGRVDLAELFDSLWERTFGEKLRYAQLFAGDTPVGPAVVLQPLLTPDLAQITRQRQIEWSGSPKVFSGYRTYVEQVAVMETSAGDIEFRMRPDEAPNSVWNFLTLSAGGFYTDIIFHRIIGGSADVPPFVVQVGDPTGMGSGGPGHFIDLERSQLPHTFGVLSMARSGDPNSNGSQVFICLSRERTRGLDGSYTAFAQAISGADIIEQLSAVRTGANDRPIEPPVLEAVVLRDAAPYGTGPKPVTRPTAAAGTGR
ncbi:MAG: peptidylprolyl isomerase [Planctomycetota bacterium]